MRNLRNDQLAKVCIPTSAHQDTQGRARFPSRIHSPSCSSELVPRPVPPSEVPRQPQVQTAPKPPDVQVPVLLETHLPLILVLSVNALTPNRFVRCWRTEDGSGVITRDLLGRSTFTIRSGRFKRSLDQESTLFVLCWTGGEACV